VLTHDAVDQRQHPRAGAHRTGGIEADLEVWTGGDADDPEAHDRDLLASVDVLPDMNQVGPGVPVVDLHAVEWAVCDLQDWRVWTESADPLADDHAIAHRILGRAAGCGVVHTLIDGPTSEVLPRQRKRDAARQDVGGGLRRGSGRGDDGYRRCAAVSVTGIWAAASMTGI
jgi:hypothetical protein